MDILDYIMIAGGTYYIMAKARDENDDGAKRTLLGIGAGLIVGYKGPEIYNKFADMKNSPEGAIMKDRLIAAGIAAGAGYMLGNKIMGTARKLSKNF